MARVGWMQDQRNVLICSLTDVHSWQDFYEVFQLARDHLETVTHPVYLVVKMDSSLLRLERVFRYLPQLAQAPRHPLIIGYLIVTDDELIHGLYETFRNVYPQVAARRSVRFVPSLQTAQVLLAQDRRIAEVI